MSGTIAARIAALNDLTVAELRAKYCELFGEETRSGNRSYLFKKIAWRMQALELGDISERARRRAAELAEDADVRIRAPKGFDPAAPDPARTVTLPMRRLSDKRLPIAGTVLQRDFKGHVIRVTVLDDGFDWDGRHYRSLSAIASEATGCRWNGYSFFGLKKRAKR